MKYNCISRLFHWVMAIAIIALLAVGLYMADQEFTPQIGKLYGLHKAFGFLVLVAAVLRVFWRFKHTPPALPADMRAFEKRLAKLGHLALYVMMFAMPLSGWAMSSAYGFPVSVFGWFTLPMIAPESKELGGIMHEVHEYAGFALIGLIVLHFCAALHHHFVRKDGVLRRMFMVAAVVGAGLTFGPTVNAADWQLDKENSHIKFTTEVNYAPSKGAFPYFEHDLKIDPNNIKETRGTVTVNLRHIEAAYPMVATTLQQKDWFNTEKWPEASFEVVDVKMQRCQGCYAVMGNLKLRATTLPIQLSVRIPQDVADENTFIVNAKGTLSRTAYGVGQGEWASTDVVADDVELDIKATFKRL